MKFLFCTHVRAAQYGATPANTLAKREPYVLIKANAVRFFALARHMPRESFRRCYFRLRCNELLRDAHICNRNVDCVSAGYSLDRVECTALRRSNIESLLYTRRYICGRNQNIVSSVALVGAQENTLCF